MATRLSLSAALGKVFEQSWPSGGGRALAALNRSSRTGSYPRLSRL
jgi:hypothetical protein